MISRRTAVGTLDSIMPSYEDEDEADLDAPEDPDVDDADWNPDPAEVPCPYCKREISEDAERCPHCGSYILHSGAPRPARPWWWVALISLVLLLLAWLIRR
jgi:hypothetical protein